MLEKIYVSNDFSEAAGIESALTAMNIRYEINSPDHVLFGSLPSVEFYVESEDREKTLYEIKRLNAAQFLEEGENPSVEKLDEILMENNTKKIEKLDAVEHVFILELLFKYKVVFISSLITLIILFLDYSGMIYEGGLFRQNRRLIFIISCAVMTALLLGIKIYSGTGKKD